MHIKGFEKFLNKGKKKIEISNHMELIFIMMETNKNQS